MLDVRLRLYSDQGVRGRVLPTSSLTFTHSDSSSATVEFTVSEKVAGRLESPFLVGVEWSTGGGWVAPRNGLLIAQETDGDSIEPSGTVRFTGELYVSWVFARAMINFAVGVGGFPVTGKDGKRTFENVTPGAMMLSLLNQATARGAAQGVTADFTGTTDSLGTAWAADDRVDTGFTVHTTPTSQALQTAAQGGFCDWWAEGMLLRLTRPGTGAQRPHVKIGGPGATRAPAKSSFRDVFTHLRVTFDGGNSYLTNTGATNRFGVLEAAMTQSGTPDAAAAARAAQPAMVQGRDVASELSFEWSGGSAHPMPWADFQVGDVVKARARSGWVFQRVVGVVVSKDTSGEVTVRTVVGSKLLTQAARVAKRAAAATVGTVIAGNGDGVAPGGTSTVPLAPANVRVTSNTGSWGSDGSARAQVLVEWDQVTQSTDLTGVTVTGYEVWARVPSGVSARVAETQGLQLLVEDWQPGVQRLVKVRAVGVAGVSGFSSEISVTPAVPSSIVPKAPTGLAVSGNTGAFLADGSAVAQVTFTWAAVTQATDNTPLTVGAYRPEVEDGTAWVPLSEVTTPLQATISVPSGRSRRVRVRARTGLGVWGDPSAPLTVTGAVPAVISAAPTTPTLTTGGGGVFIRWDGLLTNGAPPNGFQAVYGEYRVGTTGSFTRIAGPAAVASGQVGQVRPAVGDTVQARLVLVDTLGRVGATSTVASIVTEGYDGQDIIAGSIAVDKVTPAFGQDLDIAANGSVNFIIGRQDAAQSQIAQNQSEITAAQQVAANAATAASAAQAAADTVGTAVGDLQSQQENTRTDLDSLRTWFWVDIDGAHVGRSDSPFQTHVLADRFQITQSGVVQGYFAAGGLVTPKVDADSVFVANHKIEAYGTGTVVRKV